VVCSALWRWRVKVLVIDEAGHIYAYVRMCMVEKDRVAEMRGEKETGEIDS